MSEPVTIPAPPPSPALGPVPAPSASPPPTAELTPWQRRKLREAEQRRKREERRQRRAELAAQKLEETAAAPPAEPAAMLAPDRSDADRARDLAVFLSGVWLIARALASLIGWKLGPLTEAEAAEDAKSFVPMARRYPAFDSLCTWVAAPVVIIRRIAAKISRRGSTPEPAEPPRNGATAREVRHAS